MNKKTMILTGVLVLAVVVAGTVFLTGGNLQGFMKFGNFKSPNPIQTEQLSPKVLTAQLINRADAQPITRAELAKLLVEKAHIPLQTDPSGNTNCHVFSDVLDGDQYAPYICTAYYHGLFNGYSDGTFKPSNTVMRAEGAKLFLVAFGMNLNWDGGRSCPAPVPYPDTPKTSWYYDYTSMLAMYEWSDVAIGGNFRPGDVLTNGAINTWITKSGN